MFQSMHVLGLRMINSISRVGLRTFTHRPSSLLSIPTHFKKGGDKLHLRNKIFYIMEVKPTNRVIVLPFHRAASRHLGFSLFTPTTMRDIQYTNYHLLHCTDSLLRWYRDMLIRLPNLGEWVLYLHTHWKAFTFFYSHTATTHDARRVHTLLKYHKNRFLVAV